MKSRQSPLESPAAFLAQLGSPFCGEELFDCLGDVVFFVKNRRCEYVVVNRTLVVRCGVASKEALIGRRADEIFPAPLGESYRAQDELVLRSGVPILDRLEMHLHSSGRRGWCLTNKLPLRDAAGKVIGLAGLSRDLQAPNERGGDFSTVARAVEHLQHHFGSPLRVPELARLAGLSPYQFERRIRAIFKLTAGQLIQKTRIDAALARLTDGDAPIARIAHECGYADQSAFTRTFRQVTGMSPSSYRAVRRDGAQGP